MNHPYFPDLHQKFNKKKILASQQGYMQGYLSQIKETAIVISVALGFVFLGSLVVWLKNGDLTEFLFLTALSAAIQLLPLCYAIFYWREKRKYSYILHIESPKTEPMQMQCAKVKLWVIREKFSIDIMAVWLFSSNGEKYLYIYPRGCRDKKVLTIFPESRVRNQIKSTFRNRFIRFSCYEGTNIIQSFVE